METKPIPGYPLYSLSKCGKLFRRSDTVEIEIFVGRNGYRQAYLYRGKKRTRHPKMIYKLMAATYLSKRPSDKHLVRHLDGNSLNDAANNLAWGTHADNMEDLRKHREDRAPLTNKLKSSIIRAIKRSNGTTEDLQKIAKRRKVAFSTVNRLYWKTKDAKKS